jgi:ubiquitin carboxyl-terminal hydrolase 9/24
MEKLQILFDNVLADKWYIPVKQDEALGVCLIAAINLAKEHKTETVDECKRFIEYIVPEAFRKVNLTKFFCIEYSSYV